MQQITPIDRAFNEMQNLIREYESRIDGKAIEIKPE